MKRKSSSLLPVVLPLCATCWLACGSLLGAIRTSVPITALGETADVVVLATVEQTATDDATFQSTVGLEVQSVLKGQPTGTVLQVSLPPSTLPSHGKYVASALRGVSGLWFLKSDGGTLQVLTTVTGGYLPGESFLPVDTTLPTPQGTLNQKLLAYLMAWYATAPNDPSRDAGLKAMFEPGRVGVQDVSRADLAAVAQGLVSSVSAPTHLMGLVVSVQIDLPGSLGAALSEVSTLQSQPNFPSLLRAIAWYSHDPSEIPVLSQAVAQHTNIAGLDEALGAALAKFVVGQRAVVPAMATLLDSQDPNAVLRAARFFGMYAVLADAQGNVSGGAAIGPFSTADTRHFTPRDGDMLTPEQYSDFWKQWWAVNLLKLGFQSQ